MSSTSVFFTRGKEDEQIWTTGVGLPGRDDQNRSAVAITGDEARYFYQNLFEGEEEEGHERRETDSATPSCNKRKGARELRRKAQRRRASQHDGSHDRGRRRGAANAGSDAAQSAHRPQGSQGCERDGHRLLRVAQEGDLPALRKLLKAGQQQQQQVDVNFHDGFYWTAVMCASHSGKVEAVQLLLDHGASWVGVVDTQGRDARDIAEQAGHDEVVRVLDLHGSRMARSDDGEGSVAGTSTQQTPQWCSVCECLYSEQEARHQSSTLHQFNRGRLRLSRPAEPHYCLPPSSAGYRMMLRSGWNPGSGLGPEGQGPHQPVRTVLKRDQAGLGYGPAPRARVTHFHAKDPQAVQRPAKPTERRAREATLSAKAQRRKETRQRGWERDFRASFNIDP